MKRRKKKYKTPPVPKPNMMHERGKEKSRLVLSLIYLPNSIIARILFVCERNIERHVEMLLQKYKVETRTALLFEAMKHGEYIDCNYQNDPNAQYLRVTEPIEYERKRNWRRKSNV